MVPFGVISSSGSVSLFLRHSGPGFATPFEAIVCLASVRGERISISLASAELAEPLRDASRKSREAVECRRTGRRYHWPAPASTTWMTIHLPSRPDGCQINYYPLFCRSRIVRAVLRLRGLPGTSDPREGIPFFSISFAFAARLRQPFWWAIPFYSSCVCFNRKKITR